MKKTVLILAAVTAAAVHAAVFRGETSEGVTIGSGAVTNGTVTAWVKFAGLKDGNPCPRIFQWGPLYVHTGAGYGFSYGADLVIGCTSVPKTPVSKNGVSNWSPTAPLPVGEWVHFAFSFSCSPSTVPRLYLNGKAVELAGGGRPMPEYLKAGKVVLGNNAVPGKRPFHGEMADMRVFGRILSGSEISRIAAKDPDGKKPRDLATVAEDRLPLVDLTSDTSAQTVIAEGTENLYNGHPTTVLADDGTLYCVWTKNHGGPCGPMAKSLDGGRNWTRCDGIMPDEYRTHSNCPTLQRVPRPDGGTNLVVFSNFKRRCGIVISEDGGKTWKAAEPAQLSAGMPPTGFMPLKDGTSALFGQLRKPGVLAGDAPESDQAVWMSVTTDGGWTWSMPRTVATADKKNLCEPCAIRSPDGREIALLIRENRHTAMSMMCFSSDEGKSWSKPVDTCWGLCGDRHEAVYLPDGRLFVAFRDRAPKSSTYGQYVAWVGTYDDLKNAKPGEFRVHILKHHGKGGFAACDTGYSGVEVLKDGTLVCTTYTKHWADNRRHSVVAVRIPSERLKGK